MADLKPVPGPRQPGVYRHYKDGRFYLLLFTGMLEDSVKGADAPLEIECDLGKIFVATAGNGSGYTILQARAHGPMLEGLEVCVYVPLYADKPGRRISVRPVSEWVEPVVAPGRNVSRFEYVGDTIPPEALSG